MRKRLQYYLHFHRYKILFSIGFVVLVLFLVLAFTPFDIYEVVTDYRLELMWGLVVLLTAMIGVMVYDINDLRQKLEAQKEHREDQQAGLEVYNFYDEKGDLRLSARPESVYFLEAADNYVIIHYLSVGKMEKLLIRNSLKNIEWRFREKGLIRCHRSYIVNLNLVQLMRRQENEVVLDMGDDRVPLIPVSRTYATTVMEHFTRQ